MASCARSIGEWQGTAFTLSLRMAAAVVGAATDGVVPWRQDRPPNQPYSPQEALRKMTVPEGFAVELVSSEPDITNPIGMSFDDRGRIWITESIEYPRKPAGVGRDRVKNNPTCIRSWKPTAGRSSI